jgi:hypothetical protein
MFFQNVLEEDLNGKYFFFESRLIDNTFVLIMVSFLTNTIFLWMFWDRENTVTCCRKCNSQKGSTLPNKLRSVGMKLLREPRIPTKYELAAEAGKMVPRRVHPTWRPFLGIDSQSDDGEEYNFFDG